jgi:small subunit ribosomal protein S20
MANIKSQKKRIITSRKANAANRANRAALKTNLKKANAAVAASADAAEKESVVAKAFSEIDKAVRKGVIKRNTANHRKAAIAKLASKKED